MISQSTLCGFTSLLLLRESKYKHEFILLHVTIEFWFSHISFLLLVMTHLRYCCVLICFFVWRCFEKKISIFYLFSNWFDKTFIIVFLSLLCHD